MENKDLQILEEISGLAVSLRRQLEELEDMIVRLKSTCNEDVDYQYDEEDAPIDIDIDDMSAEAFVEAVHEAEPEPVEDVSCEEPVEEIIEEPEEEIIEEPVEEIIEGPVTEDPATEESVFEPASEAVNEPSFMSAPEPVAEMLAEPVAETSPVRQAVIDVLEDKRAWKTDMPGAPVRDIRSAISLNDRVLFINRLFNEDPMSFQDMLSRINHMTSLEDVVEAVVAEHPEWDLGSEIVYRFMMAVRRKVR